MWHLQAWCCHVWLLREVHCLNSRLQYSQDSRLCSSPSLPCDNQTPLLPRSLELLHLTKAPSGPLTLLTPVWTAEVSCFLTTETSSHQQARHVCPFLSWITDLAPLLPSPAKAENVPALLAKCMNNIFPCPCPLCNFSIITKLLVACHFGINCYLKCKCKEVSFQFPPHLRTTTGQLEILSSQTQSASKSKSILCYRLCTTIQTHFSWQNINANTNCRPGPESWLLYCYKKLVLRDKKLFFFLLHMHSRRFRWACIQHSCILIHICTLPIVL